MNRSIKTVKSGLSDLSDYVALVNTVGWPHKPDDISALLKLGHPWRAIEQNTGQSVGVAIWWPMGNHFGRIGLLIVAPNFQGRGIGRIIMEKVIADAGERTLMLLATEQGKPLYDSLGFKSVGLTQRHQGPYPHPSTVSYGVTPANPGDLKEIIALDTRVTGLDRASMITQMFGVGNTVAKKNKNKISGYAINRPFGAGNVIGPLIATNDDDAKTLFMAAAKPGILRVDRLMERASLGQFFEIKNLIGHEITHSMVRGVKSTGEKDGLVFAMASHAWG